MKRVVLSAVAVGAVAVAANAAPVAPYAKPVTPDYTTAAMLSAGDVVPNTSDPSRGYRMVGIPDGLGATTDAKSGVTTLYLNHELGAAVVSQPNVGRAANRGAFVSAYTVKNGAVVSGERAYDRVYVGDTYVGPAAEVGNSTRPFSRFCSGNLAGPAEGFDRAIYLTGEEDGNAAATFDGKGGSAVAIFDGDVHTLPGLGHMSFENAVVQPNQGGRTVIMGMEDGPNVLDPAKDNSQLWMYVGKKDNSKRATVLERNGLVGGTLYVFRAKDRSITTEAGFTAGDLRGEWVAIPGADKMDGVQLEAAADAVGAMTFARPEDGAFNQENTDQFLWVTTGGAAGANELGRVYQLGLHPGNVAKDATLTLVTNADAIVKNGGDAPLSPDNVGVGSGYLMVQEDGTAETRPVMGAKGRDGSIWRYDLTRRGIDAASATRVVQLAPPGRDGVAVGPGVWETSGIIDSGAFLGGGSFAFVVQAHSPTTAPPVGTVEDGQLVVMRPGGK